MGSRIRQTSRQFRGHGLSALRLVAVTILLLTVIIIQPRLSVGLASNTGQKPMANLASLSRLAAANADGCNLFYDVQPTNFYSTYINNIAMRSVTLGCGGGNYCPTDPVTRGQMAAFLIRARGEFDPPTPATQRFSDVPPTHPFYKFIDRLAVLGITVGCDATRYCPDDPVTRGQMATFIERSRGNFTPPAPAQQRFSDVLPAHPFYAFIDSFAQRCINGGYPFSTVIDQHCTPPPPSGTTDYCPDAAIRRDDMAAFLVMGFNW